MYDAIINSPIGNLGILTHDQKIRAIRFLPETADLIPPISAVAKEAVQQLQQYFAKKRTNFDLPLQSIGTDYQLLVWERVKQIPVGETLTYSDLAHQICSGPRAVGNACRVNPIPVIIPCHRIVAKNHSGGYAGNMDGRIFAIKTWLLDHEQSFQ